MTETLRIGQLATRTGRSIYAIRWYEAQGLMPGVVRDSGGRRVYTARHVSWLELMGRLRGSGMSIAQMRDYTALVRQGHSTLKQQRELLTVHRERVKQSIAYSNQALKLMNQKIGFYEAWIDTGKRPKGNPHGT